MKTVFLTTSLFFALSACAAPAAQTEAAAQQPVNWVQTSYSKPGIDLAIAHGKLTPAQAGETVTIPLRISAGPNQTIALSLASSTGLDLIDAATSSLQTGSDGTVSLSTRVRSKIEGRHYLDVTARIDGVAGQRTISVPVQVGEGGLINKSAPGDVVTQPDGTRRVIMPAKESINGRPMETVNTEPK